MAGDLEHIRSIAGRVAGSLGLELVEVDLRGGGRARTLRLVIDKPGGVTHEDCAAVSRETGTIIDVEDAVPGGGYTLEVSSPGLDRRLRSAEDFARYTGSRMKLMTRQPVNNNRHFEGRLESFVDGRLTLDLSEISRTKKKKMGEAGSMRKVEIDMANVEKANLVPEI